MWRRPGAISRRSNVACACGAAICATHRAPCRCAHASCDTSALGCVRSRANCHVMLPSSEACRTPSGRIAASTSVCLAPAVPFGCLCVIDHSPRGRRQPSEVRRHRSRQLFGVPSAGQVDLAVRSRKLPRAAGSLRDRALFCGAVLRVWATASSARRELHSSDARWWPPRHTRLRKEALCRWPGVRQGAVASLARNRTATHIPLYRDCSPMNKVNRKFAPAA